MRLFNEINIKLEHSRVLNRHLKDPGGIPWVSGIWTSLTWLWWFAFGFMFEPMPNNDQSAPNVVAHVKSGQK